MEAVVLVRYGAKPTVRWIRSLVFSVLGLVAEGRAQAWTEPPADKPHYLVQLFDEAPYFSPEYLRVPAGSTVTWENRGDSRVHMLVVKAAQGPARSGPLRPRQRWSHTFLRDAIVKASCETHPYMMGIVVIGDPPEPSLLAAQSESGPDGERAAERSALLGMVTTALVSRLPYRRRGPNEG